MHLDPKALKDVNKVLTIKKLSHQSKYAEIQKLTDMIIDKIDRIDKEISAIEEKILTVKQEFFEQQSTTFLTEKDVKLYIEKNKKLDLAMRKNKKNRGLLKSKLFEQHEMQKHYQIEMLKIDRKREHLSTGL